MNEQPTPPTPTTEDILSQIISTLFDIPEGSQITIPTAAILGRIRSLQSGFVPQPRQAEIALQLQMLNDVKGAFRAGDTQNSADLIKAIRTKVAKDSLGFDYEESKDITA